MAYHEIGTMDVWDIIRRWHQGHGIRQIARSTGYDRKTVQSYLRLAQSTLGLSPDKPLPEKEVALALLLSDDHRLGRLPEVQVLLLPYLDEINSLINPGEKDLTLKPKTAFSLICERHPELGEKVSYTSYKRFVRAHKLVLYPHLLTCRIEVEPGSEVQIDYARMGTLFDPSSGRTRVLYVFIGTLSHSRLKYVELTFSQNQMNFVASHIRMFSFFQGVPGRIILDNLKAGVIRPDLYDPRLNRTYRDMTDYYGCFVDTARVSHPKDKGKVERDVQTVREAVRKLRVQHPSATLSELNRLATDWSLNIYGQIDHGTTREKPTIVFTQREQPALKALPERPFELAEWKKATVHPDLYVQFRGKTYSVPYAYAGKTVWIRAGEHILQVFYDEALIKQHVITRAFRHTDFDDFPDNVRAALDTNAVHRSLLARSSKIGPRFYDLISGLLKAHAFINLRRAQGLLHVAESTPGPQAVVERAAAYIDDAGLKATPHELRRVLSRMAAESTAPNLVPISEATAEFIRDITYFINNTGESTPS